MTTLLTFLLLLIIHCTSGAQLGDSCTSKSCGGIEIKFPFGLKEANQNQISSRCSYPNFTVWCNNQSQTILTLPDSGDDLLIKAINYSTQTLSVNDPNLCLPRRFLQGRFNLSASPFQLDPSLYNLINLTLLRCPSNLTRNLPSVHCLSDPVNSSFTVIYLWVRSLPSVYNESCEVINSSVPYPISNIDVWPFLVDIGDDLQLKWDSPRCGRCESQEQDCGFADHTGFQIACFSRPDESSGLPRGVKYGLAIGVGIPGLVCLIGICCFTCAKIRRRRILRPSIDLPITSNMAESGPFRMGLDGPIIEK